jgi:hypothetical protein
MLSSKNLLWLAFVAFVALALYYDGHARLFTFGGPLAPIKLAIWVAFAGFLAYSVYCSARENLFRSVAKIGELHWGRQIGTDLYLGLLLALFVVYLNEGSALVALLWLVPALVFANLVTLLYFALHFEEIVGRFLT